MQQTLSERPPFVPAPQGGTCVPLSDSRAECAVGPQSMPSSAEFALSSRVVSESTQPLPHFLIPPSSILNLEEEKNLFQVGTQPGPTESKFRLPLHDSIPVELDDEFPVDEHRQSLIESH